MRGKMLMLLALMCLLLAGAGWMTHEVQVQAEEYARLQREILMLEVENALLREKVAELREQQAEIGDRMEKWLDTWEVELWESTAYAPLDSRAVETREEALAWGRRAVKVVYEKWRFNKAFAGTAVIRLNAIGF